MERAQERSSESPSTEMAMAGSGNLSSILIPSQSGNVNSGLLLLLSCSSWLIPGTVKRFLAANIQASLTTTAIAFHETKTDPILDRKKMENHGSIFACPICYGPLVLNAPSGISLNPVNMCNLLCKTCKKAYFGNETHVDLTIASGCKAYQEAMPASTELFRFSLVSFLYERGWRQSFSVWAGFPGPEKEFELIKDYLSPVLGGNIIDASCGSGLFSRRFVKSGLFSLVVALDFSEAMLRQCSEFIKQEENFPKENMMMVRADISRLPFASGTIDAVHAGAALHCWPSPSAAVAEISRVLRPGGMFVATTQIADGLFAFIPLLGHIRRNIAQISGSHIFLSNRELEDLCTACGLVDFKCTRNRLFVMICAKKPN